MPDAGGDAVNMSPQLRADCDTERSIDRIAFRTYLSRLRWTAGSFEVVPVVREHAGPGESGQGSAARPIRPGFLIHSLFGIGLRSVACLENPRCREACIHPKGCVYGRLLETHPAQSGLPLAGVERAPVPFAIDAPWSMYEPGGPLRFRMVLLGDAGALRDTVTEALIAGFVDGMDESRCPVSLVPGAWRDGRLGAAAETSGGAFRMVLTSPLRLVRRKKELAEFDLGAVVRDLGFRLAVWGCHHQGLEWPAPWRFLQDEAAAVRVTAAQVRQVSFHRYSGRQERVIPMKSLLGTVDLEGVSPDLTLLLHAGEVCGLGKGPSIGLGRITLGEL